VQETWILATRLWRLWSRALLLALRMLVGFVRGVFGGGGSDTY